MANVVKDIRHDIAGRIGTAFNPGAILRALNRVYKEINIDLLCVEDNLAIAAGEFSDSDKSCDIPANYIRVFNIVPGVGTLYGLDYIPKEKWNPTLHLNHDVFTMMNGEFVFGNVGAASAFTFYYYSAGLELVDGEDNQFEDVVPSGLESYDSDTQTNTPEWDEAYWPLLIYETCFELVPDYPLMKQDILKAAKLRALLKKANKNNQGVTPAILGGAGSYPRKRDPDYVDGKWVTR